MGKFISKVSASLFLKINAVILGFIFTSYVSRTLPYDTSDLLFILISIVVVCSSIFLSGRDLLVMREITRYNAVNNASSILFTIRSFRFFNIKLTVSILCLSYFIYYIGDISQYIDHASSYLIFLSTIPLYTLTIINCEILRGIGYYQSLIIFHGVLLNLLVSILLFIFDFNPLSSILFVSLIYFSSVILVWVSSEFYLHKSIISKFPLSSFRPALQQLPNSSDQPKITPFAIISISTVLIQYLPVIILGTSDQSSDSGIFFVSMRISLVLSFSLLAGNVIIAPLMAKSYKIKDFIGMKRLLLFSSLLGAATSLPLLFFILFYTKEILLLFGPDFITAHTCLYILLIGQLFNAISGSVIYLLIMSGHESSVALLNLLGLFIVVFFPFLFDFTESIEMSIAVSSSLVVVNVSALFLCYTKVLSKENVQMSPFAV